MIWLINYIRSCFCEHEWELLSETEVLGREYFYPHEKYSKGTRWDYICKKCGYQKTYKNYKE